MIATPAQHATAHPPGQVRNDVVLSDYINRYDPLTGDLRKPAAPNPLDALHTLLIAHDNLERAETRWRNRSDSEANAHLNGARVRHREALLSARQSIEEYRMKK